MQNNPIGVFDSGIGGTTILKSVQKLLPNENYIFFGDSKNCPFGTKSPEELKTIVKNAVDFLLARHVKLIIVACNTAT
ncbi:MAG: aspartate/glutamate racemase family protein, partial [Selenomonadaceae bacterium]|nr:aspartate/glutamate racemase family protein [Selenomonadaceae bacterium]